MMESSELMKEENQELLSDETSSYQKTYKKPETFIMKSTELIRERNQELLWWKVLN